MRKAIHPKYFDADVTCACGNSFTVGSTKENIKVEVCSKCHPYYTGNKRLLSERGGRIDKFNKKYNLK